MKSYNHPVVSHPLVLRIQRVYKRSLVSRFQLISLHLHASLKDKKTPKCTTAPRILSDIRFFPSFAITFNICRIIQGVYGNRKHHKCQRNYSSLFLRRYYFCISFKHFYMLWYYPFTYAWENYLKYFSCLQGFYCLLKLKFPAIDIKNIVLKYVRLKSSLVEVVNRLYAFPKPLFWCLLWYSDRLFLRQNLNFSTCNIHGACHFYPLKANNDISSKLSHRNPKPNNLSRWCLSYLLRILYITCFRGCITFRQDKKISSY